MGSWRNLRQRWLHPKEDDALRRYPCRGKKGLRIEWMDPRLFSGTQLGEDGQASPNAHQRTQLGLQE